MKFLLFLENPLGSLCFLKEGYVVVCCAGGATYTHPLEKPMIFFRISKADEYNFKPAWIF